MASCNEENNYAPVSYNPFKFWLAVAALCIGSGIIFYYIMLGFNAHP